MKKVTQLDALIINLERKGESLSEYEKITLNNLRERKHLEMINGIVPKPSVFVPASPDSSKSVPTKKPKSSKKSRKKSHSLKFVTPSLSNSNAEAPVDNDMEASQEQSAVDLCSAGRKASPFILFLHDKKIKL